ncbi:hypothetical protein BC827DRAFT_1202096 [Russula dissimulans]|nr:hypothetical protein BC827DRAFT_1202096 [Russula dissimulans]
MTRAAIGSRPTETVAGSPSPSSARRVPCPHFERVSERRELDVVRARSRQWPQTDRRSQGQVPPVPWVGKGDTRLPFFCGDVTPRELMVPTHPPSNTEHPNGMLSIVHLVMLMLPLVSPAVTTELTAMIGEEPIDISLSERVWLHHLPGQVAPSDPMCV